MCTHMCTCTCRSEGKLGSGGQGRSLESGQGSCHGGSSGNIKKFTP